MIKGNEFLKNEYPVKYRAQFVPIIRQAKEIVKQLYSEQPLFQSATAENERSKIVNIAVEYEFQRRIEEGLLPFDYNIKYNSAKNHKHLEIITKHTIMTISQVSNKTGIPRSAKFRSNLAYSNQMVMEFLKDTIRINDSKAYILLSHNSKTENVKRVILGLPAPDTKSWIYSLDLLNEIVLASINDEIVDETFDDEEWLVSIKQGIIQEVKNRGGSL